MAKYYRDKHKRDTDHQNLLLWLQGAYVYEAMLEVSPAYNFWVKERKPEPYRSEPIPLGKIEREQREQERQRKKMEAGKKIMMGLMESVNAKMKKEKETDVSQTGNP